MIQQQVPENMLGTNFLVCILPEFYTDLIKRVQILLLWNFCLVRTHTYSQTHRTHTTHTCSNTQLNTIKKTPPFIKVGDWAFKIFIEIFSQEFENTPSHCTLPSAKINKTLYDNFWLCLTIYKTVLSKSD